MNKDNNNFGNQPNGNNKTRSFTNTSKIESDNSAIKVDTDVNIKKATVKRKVKKGVFGTLFVVKKAFQWTFNVILTVLLIGTITSIIVGCAGYIYVQNHLVVDDFDIDPTELREALSQTSWIYYDEEYGDEYAPIELYGTENRMWVTYDQIPEKLVDAFVAIEDERYWQHNGVDWRRTFGAAKGWLTGSDSYGGSTITQQLIKNVTGENETTVQRKVGEIFRALRVTELRTKEEVLEMYLNRIHLSRSNYGVWAAAKYYFGKDIAEGDELTLVECAALASIPKSPTKYDPVRNPEYNKERRETVLWKMEQLGWITKEEYEEAINTELELRITYEETQQQVKYSYFTDALIEQLVEDLDKEYGMKRAEALNLLYTGGLTIYSTEDPVIQRKMEEIFNDEKTFQKVDDGVQPQSAMVVMDPYTGKVVGLVGGRGEKDGKLDLNRATQSTRQVGSSIKPLTVYSPAMDLGIINYGTALDDSPVFMKNMGRYWPSNSPNRYDGHISVNEAVMKSKNTTAVKLVKDSMGVDYVYDFAVNSLHLESLVDSDKNVAPLALGGFTYGLTVMEMTAAYSIFPNDGYYSPPRLYTKVLRPDGTILLDRRENEEEYVISEATSTVMTKILENVVWGGTASKIQLKTQLDCAGKTGSTNDNKDIYYCGFTPYYVGACWFGYDIPKDLTKFGTNPAMLAWEKVMRAIHEPYLNGSQQPEKFDFSKLVSATVCKDSGMIPGPLCNVDPRGDRTISGWYYEGINVPSKTCTAHTSISWCPESNMPAGPYCPGAFVSVRVVETSRTFAPGEISVGDADYTYNPESETASVCTLHTTYNPSISTYPGGSYTPGAPGADTSGTINVGDVTAGPSVDYPGAYVPQTGGSYTPPEASVPAPEVNDTDYDTTLDDVATTE